MGQQQLLLIVLGVIIVGVAVIVGIHLFEANARQSAIDAQTNEVVSIATMAMGYYKKPKAFSGGGSSFEGFTYPFLGDSTNPTGTIFYTDLGIYLFTTNPVNGREQMQIRASNLAYKPYWLIICWVYNTSYIMSVSDQAM